MEGGVLSLVQLLMDGGVTHDWSPVTGNPVKFALGSTSLFFDAIFLVQHFVLYPERPCTARSQQALSAADAAEPEDDLEAADEELEQEPLVAHRAG